MKICRNIHRVAAFGGGLKKIQNGSRCHGNQGTKWSPKPNTKILRFVYFGSYFGFKMAAIANQRWISIRNIIIYLEFKFLPNRRIFVFWQPLRSKELVGALNSDMGVVYRLLCLHPNTIKPS
jgi:hypothetical protein